MVRSLDVTGQRVAKAGLKTASTAACNGMTATGVDGETRTESSSPIDDQMGTPHRKPTAACPLPPPTHTLSAGSVGLANNYTSEVFVTEPPRTQRVVLMSKRAPAV